MSTAHLHPPSANASPRGILITDFDGTITTCDYFELVRARWPQVPDPWDMALAGRIPMSEALRRIFAGAQGSEAEFLALAEHTGVGPDTGAAYARITEAGWRVVVASAGCDFYIRHILGRVGMFPEIVAHPGTFQEGQGLRMGSLEESPFAHPRFGLHKANLVRHFLGTGLPVVFAGDGTPDLEPLLVIPPACRYATGWVADQLASRNEGFHRFERWPDLADMLLANEAALR